MMKYAIVIIVATAVFTILGIGAACGASRYSINNSSNAIGTFMGGLIGGFIVGCLAAVAGSRLTGSHDKLKAN